MSDAQKRRKAMPLAQVIALLIMMNMGIALLDARGAQDLRLGSEKSNPKQFRSATRPGPGNPGLA